MAARSNKPADSRWITIEGAREHNLRNLSVRIPRNKLVVITGVSGSGKSTLAFDILFSEGQRRFLDSLNAYARQFVEQMPRPDVDAVHGLPPTVSIEQRISRGGGKSTVATVTTIGSAFGHIFFTTETQATVTALARLYNDGGFVYELHQSTLCALRIN